MSTTDLRQSLRSRQRIVIKIGSALLTTPSVFNNLAEDLHDLLSQNPPPKIILVSSGAIALGLRVLNYAKRPKRLHALQAAAAAGQPRLMHAWQEALNPYGRQTAQVLLTHADLASRVRFLNIRHTLNELLKAQVLPIINENDSVANEEIKVGDNDQLAASVANLVEADLLIILTTTAGVYNTNPENDPQAYRLSTIHKLSELKNLELGGASKVGLSVGGMQTKIKAAMALLKYGVPVVIAGGREPHILKRLFNGEDLGTLFVPSAKKHTSRKQWISFTLKPKGKLFIDQGASQALLHEHRSLLASGIINLTGNFSAGSMVEIYALTATTTPPSYHLIGQGLSAYTSLELQKIKGRNSKEIASLLGYAGAEVIHRDDLVLTEEPTHEAS